ncbi:hypothetical protein PCK2_000944, partial [Pneumocystis canis]
MNFLRTKLGIFRFAKQPFFKFPIVTSKGYVFAPSYVFQKKAFSTGYSIYGYTEVLASKELSTKLASEINLEMLSLKDDIPERVKTFIEAGTFKIIHNPNSNEVELIREFKNEKINVSFSVSDINNIESEDFYNEENEQTQQDTLKEKEELSEYSQEDAALSFPIRCNITITKFESGTLLVDAVAQDGTFMIDNIIYYKDNDLALTQTAEADWQRRGTYMGPSFNSLDE